MILALSPFTHQTNPSASLPIVSGGHYRLAEHHLIEWLPVPATHSFTQPGTGDDSIEPPKPFTYVDADDTPKDMHTTVEGIARAKLSGDPDVPRQVHDKRSGLSKEPKFTHCSPAKEQMIKDAVSDAYRALEGAIVELDRNHGPGSIFERWFGSGTGPRVVRENLDGFKAHLDFSRYTFDCVNGDLLPSKISKYTLQLRDLRPVTDRSSLDQSSDAKKSRSMTPSGTSCRVPNRLKSSAWRLGATRTWLLRHLVQLQPVTWL